MLVTGRPWLDFKKVRSGGRISVLGDIARRDIARDIGSGSVMAPWIDRGINRRYITYGTLQTVFIRDRR